MRVDAVIVGARCAGAATALLLARPGARVLLVDKGVYGSDTTDGEVQSLHRAFSSEMSREVRALAALEPFTWLLPSASAPHIA